jgi:hypothetical protein
MKTIDDLRKYGLSDTDVRQLESLPVGYPITITKSVNKETLEEKRVDLVKISSDTFKVERHYTYS